MAFCRKSSPSFIAAPGLVSWWQHKLSPGSRPALYEMGLCLQIVLETLIDLTQITGIICAKSVIEEDFPSNYRKMAVLIKVLITGGDPIFGYFKLCLFTTKSQMVSSVQNQKYKLDQSQRLARISLVSQISHKDIPRSCRIVWGTIIIVEMQVRAVLNNLEMGMQFREMVNSEQQMGVICHSLLQGCQSSWEDELYLEM